MSLLLRQDTATVEEIEQHLRECDGAFVPLLSLRVDLGQFAAKIHAKAVRFEAWDDTHLVGLVSAYFNEPEQRLGFVNHVGTVPSHAGRGVARSLLGRCLAHARQAGFAFVGLEVAAGNARAIALYRRLGFVTTEQDGDSMQMRLDLA